MPMPIFEESMTRDVSGAAITTVDLESQHRIAEFRADSVNEDKRTVDVVFSTGSRVLRYRYDRGRYSEELSIDTKHMDLSRLNGGAPVLDSHSFYNLGAQLGVVERAWVADGVAMATLRLSARDDVEPVWQDIRDGIIRNVSVGYSVQKYEITKNEDKPDEYRAVEWQPFEISFVTVPADADAGVRQNSQNLTPCILEMVRSDPPQEKGIDMPKAVKKAEQTAATETRSEVITPTTEVVDNVDAGQSRAADSVPAAGDAPLDEAGIRAAERDRVTGIQTAARAVGLDDGVATRLIDQGLSVDQAKVRMHDEVAARQELTASRTQVDVPHGGQNEHETRLAGMENALEHRSNPQIALEDHGREFRGLNLMDLARRCVEIAGGQVRGLSGNEVAALALGDTRSAGMMSTSDFPVILGNVVGRTLRRAYETAPSVFRQFSNQVTASDFKDMTRVQLGEAPDLEKVNESGEFKHGSLGEASEKYKIATYGKIIAITRQTIINDDLGAFQRLPRMMGRAAAELEADTVMGIITGNPKMNDNVTLFHNTHKNLAAAASVIDVANISLGRKAMRKQTGVTSTRPLNLLPRFLMVPTDLETTAEQFLSKQYLPTKDADINTFKDSLTLLVDPRLDADSATAWYLISDPAQIDTIEYAYLEGQQGVYLETKQGFEVDGVQLKVRLDFGAAPIDWRGFYKNAGQ